MRGFAQRKERRKLCNYIIILKIKEAVNTTKSEKTDVFDRT